MLGKLLSVVNTPRKWLHAVLGLGRRHPPREVAFGLLLGWLIGFGPWGLHTAVPLMLLVLMRTFWPMAIAGFAAGTVVWPLAASYTEGLGHSLLSSKGMIAGWVQWASGAPVLAWMNLNEYRMVGAMAIGIVIGGAGSIALRVLLGVLMKFGIGKIGPWVFSKVAKATGAGPTDDESVRETLWTKGPFRFVRPGGLIAVPVLAVLVTWIGSASAGPVLQQQLATQMSAHLGTTVTVGDLAVSFTGGSLEINDLTIWDPERPKQSIAKVETLRLKLETGALLSRRVHATEAVLRGLELRITRRPSGALNLDSLAPFKSGGGGGGGGSLGPKDLLGWAKSKALEAADLEWADVVEQLRPYLEQRADRKGRAAAEFPPPGDGAGWNVPHTKPAWLIERAALEACRLEFAGKKSPVVVESVSGEIRQWSSDRTLHTLPVKFELTGSLSGASVGVQGALDSPANGGALTLRPK